MSSATKSPDAALREAVQGKSKSLPPHVVATFTGDYYKSAGTKGKDYAPYTKEVKVPLSVIEFEGLTPVAFFEKHHAEKMVRELGGIVSADSRHTRICELVEVKGDLPRGITLDQKLNWTADYAKLREIAIDMGKVSYVRIDLMDEKRYQESVAIIPELYPTAAKLRNAIKTLSNPDSREAFARDQAKLEQDYKEGKGMPKDMLAEIAALAD
ncbi:MAG TPA: hypothetical protein V6D22_13610 [Candidatus Obscuribacterales bacterium]